MVPPPLWGGGLTGRGIDLGGIGKGYLIDKLAKELQEKFSLKYFLINGGGDMYGTSDNEKEIKVYLQHPIESYSFIGSIKIKNQAFCCSSSFKRCWAINGVEYNHFVDTKKENLILASSYVVAPTATEADVYATVLCIVSDHKNKLSKIMENRNANRNKKIEYLVFDRNADKLISNNFIYE